MADSNRPPTARADSGQRQAAALERIAVAAESIDARLGALAGVLEGYRPALDRVARMAGSPAARVASLIPRPGGHRG